MDTEITCDHYLLMQLQALLLFVFAAAAAANADVNHLAAHTAASCMCWSGVTPMSLLIQVCMLHTVYGFILARQLHHKQPSHWQSALLLWQHVTLLFVLSCS